MNSKIEFKTVFDQIELSVDDHPHKGIHVVTGYSWGGLLTWEQVDQLIDWLKEQKTGLTDTVER